MPDTDIFFGAEFWRGDNGDPIVYTESAAEVIDIGLPTMTKDTEDATHMKSPERFKEFIGKLRDAGEIVVSIQFGQLADLTEFYDDFRLDTAVNYKVAHASVGDFVFAGICTEVGPATKMNNRLTCDIKFKLTGKPAFLV